MDGWMDGLMDGWMDYLFMYLFNKLFIYLFYQYALSIHHSNVAQFMSIYIICMSKGMYENSRHK